GVSPRLQSLSGLAAGAHRHPRPATGPETTGLRICCLGAFSLAQNGRAFEWPRKTPKRPLDLLKAIIACGAAGASVLPLVAALWPDIEGDRAHRAFTTALYRLRTLLGEKTVIQGGGWLRLNQELVWVDVFAFEDLVSRPQDSGTEAAAVFELYRGKFLP